jgi:predicted nucleotidyltransferase
MSVRLNVDVPEAVLGDIDQAVAEGRFPTREAAVQAALRALADPEVSERLSYREHPPTLDELRARRDEILAVAASWGATNVRVFGSVARGEATDGADVDLLVDLERERTLLDLGGLVMDLRDLLGVPVDVGTDVKPRIRERVLAEAVPL